MKRKKNPDELNRRIQVLNRQRRLRICRAAVSAFCADVLRILNMEGPELSVAFVSSREMRVMNNKYLGRDYATDVLSFYYDDMNPEGRRFLGEIVIAPQVAVLQAARFGMRPESEMRKLLVHGILHLLGYNHESDKGRMIRLQARLLRKASLAALPPLMKKKETR